VFLKKKWLPNCQVSDVWRSRPDDRVAYEKSLRVKCCDREAQGLGVLNGRRII